MKTKEQLIERYNYLYEKMKHSESEYKHKVFMDAGNQMFCELAKTNTDLADRWVNKLEAICWNNYLTDMECRNISVQLFNQDGTKGFHWDYPIFKSHLAKMGVDEEEEPFYNCYALLATLNMIYSDHARSISEDMGHATPSEVPDEKMFKSCYRKAVEKLKDKDRPFFVRKYFKHELSA